MLLRYSQNQKVFLSFQTYFMCHSHWETPTDIISQAESSSHAVNLHSQQSYPLSHLLTLQMECWFPFLPHKMMPPLRGEIGSYSFLCPLHCHLTCVGLIHQIYYIMNKELELLCFVHLLSIHISLCSLRSSQYDLIHYHGLTHLYKSFTIEAKLKGPPFVKSAGLPFFCCSFGEISSYSNPTYQNPTLLACTPMPHHP